MILNALEGKALPVYGDGKNIRDWLYVEDHCQAIWEIIKRGKTGETYNIGGNCEMENLSLVQMLCDMVDELAPAKHKTSRRELITFVKDRPGHDRRYAIDATKLKNELGWTPKTDLKSGLQKTIAWYMEHPDWVNSVKTGEYRNWIKQQYK
jgi:dTDP-glucose 4,6-dehydratase